MAMDLSRKWAWLRPGEIEKDPRFREELLRLSHRGLWVTGIIEVAVPVLMFIGMTLAEGHKSVLEIRVAQVSALSLIGALTIAASRWNRIRTHSRMLVALSGWAAMAVLIGTAVLLTPRYAGDDQYIPSQMTAVMLVAVATTPLRPLHTLTLGLSIAFLYLGLSLEVALSGWTSAWDAHYFVFMLIIAVLSTAVTGVVYSERAETYRAQQEAVRIAREMAAGHARALLSENAVAVGRLAAALTHEINSPLGALKSAVDTLLVVAGKQAAAAPEEHQRLISIQADLRRSVMDSIARMQNVIARLKRFINLEDTEMHPADINELLSDVAILFARETSNRVKMEFDLRPVPSVTCRRQQLTGVFSSLLSNAINAVNGDGRIRVASRRRDTGIEVTIEDNGRGMAPEELENIFDPAFKVSEGRVSSGNWSLFSSRQVIFEHGGDIRIRSAVGEGTTVSVTLPC